MSSQDNINKSNSENKVLNRRNMLLAGTTLRRGVGAWF